MAYFMIDIIKIYSIVRRSYDTSLISNCHEVIVSKSNSIKVSYGQQAVLAEAQRGHQPPTSSEPRDDSLPLIS